jgi:superfamily I DNA/RNA helicase
MINPDTNSLLVLYDDAQSIYNGTKKLRFSFSSVGVQAKGRTTILKLNYRNTKEILAVARAFADDLLSSRDAEEDQAPTVLPMSAGRHGPKPLLIKLPTLQQEAEHIAQRLLDGNRMGIAWSEMAVIYRRYSIGQNLAAVLARRGIPVQWQQDKKQGFSPSVDSVKLITMHSSKGLEFPLVCIPGVGAGLKDNDDIQEEARLLYVAMTRATHELVMTHGEASLLTEKMSIAMNVLQTL